MNPEPPRSQPQTLNPAGAGGLTPAPKYWNKYWKQIIALAVLTIGLTAAAWLSLRPQDVRRRAAEDDRPWRPAQTWEFDAGTVIPTSTPAACNPLSDCSGSYPGFHYDFTPRFPECAMPPSYPDGTGKPDPYYNAASFGDYTCDLARCGGSCGTVYDCSYSYFGYSYSYIPTNYPACLPGTHACGGTSYPNWAGEDPACDFANSNGDDFTRDVACGAAACVTPTPTPTPGFGLTTPAPPTPGFGRRRR